MTSSPPLQSEAAPVRVYVWEWPVRTAHWLTALSLIVLTVTGYYLYRPFVIATNRTDYIMATMRFTHVTAGFVFMIAFLLRMYWMFVGNRWAHWDQFVPTRRSRWTDLVQTAKYYSFLRWRPTANIGHNALAGAAYSVVYLLALIEIVTGLALFSHVLGSRFWTIVTGWPLRLVDIQYVREIHFLVMFTFWMFFLHHLYSAMLVSKEEKTGVMESIFSGYKFIPGEQLLEQGTTASSTSEPASSKGSVN
jgi:Ni/Fe-hydrogenase 1 B-type cytochrome subunit